MTTSDDPRGALNPEILPPPHPVAMAMRVLPPLPGSWNFSLVGGEALGGNSGGLCVSSIPAAPSPAVYSK